MVGGGSGGEKSFLLQTQLIVVRLGCVEVELVLWQFKQELKLSAPRSIFRAWAKAFVWFVLDCNIGAHAKPHFMSNPTQLSKPRPQLNLTSSLGWVLHDYHFTLPHHPPTTTKHNFPLPPRGLTISHFFLTKNIFWQLRTTRHNFIPTIFWGRGVIWQFFLDNLQQPNTILNILFFRGEGVGGHQPLSPIPPVFFDKKYFGTTNNNLILTRLFSGGISTPPLPRVNPTEYIFKTNIVLTNNFNQYFFFFISIKWFWSIYPYLDQIFITE